MQYLGFDSSEAFLEESHFTKQHYYIAHLLDRILLGKGKSGRYDELKQALKDGQVLELHLFNEEKEIFITRDYERYLIYNPLFHEDTGKEDCVITRRYELMPGLLQANGMEENSRLEVREYIDFDEESHMAYVEKTVLYRFVGGERNEQI